MVDKSYVMLECAKCKDRLAKNLLACSICKWELYCSVDCQRRDWASHKGSRCRSLGRCDISNANDEKKSSEISVRDDAKVARGNRGLFDVLRVMDE